MIRIAMAVAAVLAPGLAQAQAYQCAIPDTVPRPRPDLPTRDQPRRVLPIGGYTLAITWAPQHCRTSARSPASRFGCASGNRFGFTLHGLWPDGVGKDWPQYCKATTLLPPREIVRHLCATPAVQLIQHEWAKHGTCTRDTPARFLDRSRRLYARLRYPDMEALSRTRALTAGRLAAAIARANPGVRPEMMRITANKQGWLDEVWLCLDKAYRYRRCPRHQGGLPVSAPIKIWRGVR